MSSNVNSILRRSVSCYFCGEFMEEKYLPEHLKHCGAILEECPEKCGVYVPRRNLQNHRKLCVASKVHHRLSSASLKDHQDSLWKDKVLSILGLLRKAVDEGERERRSLRDNLTSSLNFLQRKQEGLDLMRLNLVEVIEETREANSILEERICALELAYKNAQDRMQLNFEQTFSKLRLLEDQLESMGKSYNEEMSDWKRDLKDFKTFLGKESLMVSNIWEHQVDRIHDLKLELEMRCKSVNSLKDAQGVLSGKIDLLLEELCSNKEALESQKTDLKTLKFQMKDNVEYVESILKDSMRTLAKPMNLQTSSGSDLTPVSQNGRLLWRIDRYKEKMSEARESDSVLYSPLFLNKEYGYTLRLELFMNGRSQWKDRHIIGCLQVIPGKWDPLLDWPCVLRATVVLRDQENPANDIRKIVKTVGRDKVDPENVDKQSGIYMFIPHTALSRYPGLTKNDVMFLDVRVKDLDHGSMPSLSTM